jgi:hypothetical protein
LFKTISTHTFLLFPRRILQHKEFSISWNCSHFLTICYTNVCQCVICVLCFTHYKCWHSYLTSSSVLKLCFVTDCCNYGCPMYLIIQSFVPRLYPITLMYDLESVLIPKTNVSFMYTLDVFYILNFAICFADLWNVK